MNSELFLIKFLDELDLELSEDLLGHWFYHSADYSFMSPTFPQIEDLNKYIEDNYAHQ